MMELPGWFRRARREGDDERFGLAVVGTGHGAKKMCDAVDGSPSVRVAAVVSSTREKAARFGSRYGAPGAYSYDEFERIAEDPAIAAVYLALPVGLHRSFTERAVRAGKHVLCEKPMASSVADAEAMIAAASHAGRLLMVAYRLDYDPMHAQAARLLDEGVLGHIESVESTFGIVAKGGWRFEPALAGGGSLFDVGVYPMHALRKLFGEPHVTAAEIVEAGPGGMELDARWSGTLAGRASFVCRSSYIERIADELHITGDRGTLRLRHAFAYERTRLEARWRDAGGREQIFRAKHEPRAPSLFRLEAEHLAFAAQAGVPLRSPGESGLRDLETIARIEAIAVRTQR